MTEYCDLEPDKKWEIIKYEIRKFSLRFSKRLKAESRKIQTQLEKDLQNLTAAHDSGQEVHDELDSVKRELGEIELTKARATIFRSRANWSQVGERPTKYFLNLEKRNYVNKQISQLEDEGGHLVSTQKQILNMQKQYYENLYSQNEGELDVIDDSCQFTETENLPALSENQRTLIDRPLTKQDFLNSLKLLKNAKCPGSDGLTAEFYKFFWTDIGDCVTESLLYSTEVGYLSTEQKRGVISLIPKKGKNRLLLGNWRPISLLNTDYKIYTKTLAERIKPHLPNIINKDQNGFVSSRYIGTNIRTVEDVISFCSMKGLSGMVMAIDFEKAFDKLRWDFIFKALESFGFGNTYISWVRLLYRDVVACVTNNGYTSDWFKLTCGTRQGCCLSPFLFVVAVELLAHSIRMNINIEGVKVGNSETKISQFADDTTCFLKTPSSLGHLLDCLRRFRRYSGLKMNRYKTQFLSLGGLDTTVPELIDIAWSKKITVLGITMSENRSEIQNYTWNYKPQIEKLMHISRDWRNRNISIKGKATIINSLMLPCVMYPAMVTSTPPRVIDEVNRVVYRFLWNSSKNKVARATVQGQIVQGGLAIRDLQTKIQVSNINWIKRLYRDPDTLSGRYMKILLRGETDLKIYISTKSEKYIKKESHFFYHQILHDWHNFHNVSLCKEAEVRNEILWNNKFITIDRKPILWKEWKDAGILRIEDILENGSFMSDTKIAQRYGVKCNFLQALQIRQSIPGGWRNSIVSRDFVAPVSCIWVINRTPDIVNLFAIPNKDLYWIVKERSSPFSMTNEKRWAELFPKELHEWETWSKIYALPYMVTRETKLQSFQYKVIHRILVCNKYLSNIRVKNSPVCTYCDGQNDTIEHFLVKCPPVGYFWKSVFKWLNLVVKVDTTGVGECDLLFGLTQKRSNRDVLNLVLLKAKYYIYRQRLYHNCQLDILEWLKEFKMSLLSEQYICNLENKSKKFVKWMKVLDVM